jgi:hypothetical protein
MAPLQDGELLAQCKILKEETSMRAKNVDQRPETEPDEAKRGQEL